MIPIVVPSMGRSHRVHAKKVFTPGRVIVCVPDAEVDAYIEANDDVEVVGHPNDVVGIAQKRQWIYAKWGDVVMIDDDTTGILHMEHGFGEQPHPIPPKEADALVKRLAREAAEFGAYLFGLGSSANPQAYMAIRPYRLTGWVNGGFTGLLAGSKLSYHPAIMCSEDYWVSAMNAYHHRRCLIDTRYALRDADGAGTMKTTGGMATIRSSESLKRDVEILREYFGDAMKEKKKLSYTSNLHADQVSFMVPW